MRRAAMTKNILFFFETVAVMKIQKKKKFQGCGGDGKFRKIFFFFFEAVKAIEN
jgi:hypothetical protein